MLQSPADFESTFWELVTSQATLTLLWTRTHSSDFQTKCSWLLWYCIPFLFWHLKKNISWGQILYSHSLFSMKYRGSLRKNNLHKKPPRFLLIFWNANLVKSAVKEHYFKVNFFFPFSVTCSWYNDVWVLMIACHAGMFNYVSLNYI